MYRHGSFLKHLVVHTFVSVLKIKSETKPSCESMSFIHIIRCKNECFNRFLFIKQLQANPNFHYNKMRNVSILELSAANKETTECLRQ